MPDFRLPLWPRMRPLLRAAAGISLLVGVSMGVGGCQTLQRIRNRSAGDTPPTTASAGDKATRPAEPLVPSPRLIIGRVVSVDAALRQAIVELGAETPAEALLPDAELITRDSALRETGRLRVSRQLRGRILGTFSAAGSPAVNNEVVWLAP